MAGDDEVVMVNNTYKDAVRSARSACVSPAARLEDALRAARRAMDAGAWQGPMGEDFSGELNTYRSRLNEAGPAALDDFDRVISGQPERVPSTAWQVRWQRMGLR
ncbi:hypothetical protein [uncultured Serinicoccus sp.]|uniref:hypothetical protein n=1 Tax=uncultured Serinicoccus sp. TaxID=735514 RepID=UPI00262724E3|nr:hypothetical protein [uncultured Serinicoccus sp.]